MTLDARARRHIKVLAEEIQPTAADGTGSTAQVFMSGMLSGLAAAAKIADGARAEDVLEDMVRSLGTAASTTNLGKEQQ